MPRDIVSSKFNVTPGENVQDMIHAIVMDTKLTPKEKQDALAELQIERFTLESAEQAGQAVSDLAEIVETDSSSAVRLAALAVMERIVSNDQHAALINEITIQDWLNLNAKLRKARKETELLVTPVPARNPVEIIKEGQKEEDAPLPTADDPAADQLAIQPTLQNTVNATPQSTAQTPKQNIPSGATAGDRPEKSVDRKAEDAMLQAQEKAVSAIKQANVPVELPSAERLAAGPEPEKPKGKVEPARPVSAPEMSGSIENRVKPEPTVDAGRKANVEAQSNAELPILKFLRSIADTDNEESVRKLASRVVERMHMITTPQPAATHAPSPSLDEG